MPDIKHAIIIADAGGTSIDWHLHIVEHQKDATICSDYEIKTPGVNAANAPAKQVKDSFAEAHSALTHQVQNGTQCSCDLKTILSAANSSIFFYGAGCKGEENIARVKAALSECFSANNISINSDLLGAARATLGHKPGIIAIAGTGSNSGYYNGIDIIANTPPLGYILGDEGSGTSIGKKFLSDVFKKIAPASVTDYVIKQLNITQESVIKAVYQSERPAWYLASQTKTIAEILNLSKQFPKKFEGATGYIENLLTESFTLLFTRNFEQYKTVSETNNVSFVGSVAVVFNEYLKDAAGRSGYNVIKITGSPLAGLINFHINTNCYE